MRLPALIIALFVSGQALAQTSSAATLSFTGGSNSLSLNGDTCADSESVSWSEPTPTVACQSPLTIWITAGTCATTGPSPNDVIIQTIPTWQGTSGTVSFLVSNLPLFHSTDGGTASTCGPTPAFPNQQMFVCSFPVSCTAGSLVTATITFDNVPPGVPTLSLSPLDSALGVAVTPNSADTDVSQVALQYRQAVDGGGGSFISQGPPVAIDSTISIRGLEDGTTYEVQAQAFDSAGNHSDWSASQFGTPVHTQGFFDNYKNSGGADRGGCAVAEGGLSTSALMLLGWLLSRRRRR